MADQPKKVRTAAQAALNGKLKAAAAALKAAGIPAFAPNQMHYVKEKDAGKAEEVIFEEIRQRQVTRKAAVAAKKTGAAPAPSGNAAPKAVNGVNGTQNNKPKAAVNGKVRTQKQLNADKKMRNMKAAFNTHKIKYGAPAMKHFKNEKAKGRNNAAIYEEMKALFPKFELNATGAEKPIVAKRAVTAKKAGNVVPVAAVGNAGVAKGMYVCEKCRLVANNTRRNNRGNNKPANVVPLNYTYNEQGF